MQDTITYKGQVIRIEYMFTGFSVTIGKPNTANQIYVYSKWLPMVCEGDRVSIDVNTKSEIVRFNEIEKV